MTIREIRNKIILLKGVSPQPVKVKMEIQHLQQLLDYQSVQKSHSQSFWIFDYLQRRV
jgi:hypothetical protein